MYIDKKITTWVRDHYDDTIVTAKELIENPDTEKGFTERENLFDCETPVVNRKNQKVIELYSEGGNLIYRVKENIFDDTESEEI
jgi:hypothetical protein